MKFALILLVIVQLGCFSCTTPVFISSASKPQLDVSRLRLGQWYTITHLDGREYGFELTQMHNDWLCGTMQQNLNGRMRKAEVRLPVDQIYKVELSFCPESNIIFDSFQAEPPQINSELFNSVLRDEFKVTHRDGRSFFFEKPVEVDRNFLYGRINQKIQREWQETEVKIPLPQIIRIEELFLL